MSVKFLGFSREGTPIQLSLDSGVTIIGRADDCDLRIRNASVSRYHCELTIDGKWGKVKDLGSANGTFVNRNRVNECTLKPGDCVTIGPVTVVLQIEGFPKEISRSMVRGIRHGISNPGGGRFQDTMAGATIMQDVAAEPAVEPDSDLDSKHAPGNMWLIVKNVRHAKPDMNESSQSMLGKWFRFRK